MQNRNFSVGFVMISLMSFACDSAPKNGDYKLGSERDTPQQGYETVVVVGTNDIHGTLAPIKLKSREAPGVAPIDYEAGGAAVLASYIKVLKSEYGDHFIWIDGGDQFQGSIESNIAHGSPMVNFFNTAGLTAAAVGNHEFDFGVDTLKTRMLEAKYPYLAANIAEKNSNKPASFPNTTPHMLIQRGKLKIGIIGLTTTETPFKTLAQNVKDLRFEDFKDSTIRESQILREKGAHIILLAAHGGLKCDPGRNPGRVLRKSTDPQGECSDQDEIVPLLRSLPSGTIDAVVAGHTHTVVHHWISGVPVIQGGAFGRFFNVVYLTYDWAQKRLITEDTRIEGPVPVCAQVFQNQNDCNGDRPAPSQGRGPFVAAKFHRTIIHPDVQVAKILAPAFKNSENIQNKELGIAAHPIEISKVSESALGNLLADALREKAKTNVAFVNEGGIRAPLEAGPITYGAVFRAMPFDNTLAVLKLTGKELELLLRVAQSGVRAFGSVSGLQLTLIDPTYKAPVENLNKEGLIEYWETNRLIDIKTESGLPIKKDQLYTVATLDFLVTGGDGLGWVMSQIPANRIEFHPEWIARDILAQHIEKLGTLNTEDKFLVSKNSPRLRFSKTPAPKKVQPKRKKVALLHWN